MKSSKNIPHLLLFLLKTAIGKTCLRNDKNVWIKAVNSTKCPNDQGKATTPCYLIGFSHFDTDDERWYWQLDFSSKITLVTLLCGAGGRIHYHGRTSPHFTVDLWCSSDVTFAPLRFQPSLCTDDIHRLLDYCLIIADQL